jgi:hypothetical protein
MNEQVRLLREIRDQLKGRETTQADRIIAAITEGRSRSAGEKMLEGKRITE